ncbi:MAG: DUF4129 domain-containing protein [Planctomycetota bacterium]|nr:MAG: DUF4129 domain-containing protein [Planctomycetota bacterium]
MLKNLSLLLALLTTLYLLRKKIYPSLKKLLSYLLHYLKQFLKQKQTLHHPHQPSTKSQKPSPTPHHSSLRQKAILAYLHYLNFLKKIGQPLPNYLTPEEHLQTTEKQKKRKQPHLQELVKIFLKARYSLEPISEAEAQKAEICSRWLQQNLKSTN